MSDNVEWRVLPEFPKYEITEDGDVRNRRTGKAIQETQNKNTKAWSYCLRRKDGKTTHRAHWGLVESAFPHLAVPKPEKKPKRIYHEKRDIPDFPRYQIDATGVVRFVKSRQRIPVHKDHTEYVILYNDKGQKKWRLSIDWLMSEIFPEMEREAA